MRRLGLNWTKVVGSALEKKRPANAEEAEDLSDLAWLLRTRNCGTVDKGGFAGLGFEEQPFPSRLRQRSAGTDDTFNEKAALPRDLGVHPVKRATTKARPPEKQPRARKLDDKATIAAALALEREEKRRERERQKELAAQEKQRKQRELAIAKAKNAFEEAKRTHETKIKEIEDARSELDRKGAAEDARWQKQRAKLEAVLARE